MTLFLTAWALSFVSLGIALVAVATMYRLLGSDLGLGGVGSEIIIAVIASAAQAGLLAGIFAAMGAPHLYHYMLAGVLAALVYRVSHLADMEPLATGVLVAFQFVFYLLGSFLFSVM